ncbi:SufD family Fe-S cluster assembly protein [Candidatus Pelagibacter sp.]|nr:SufD family Fe-S cluster assembly protein [Candidatus Pelagibacter sp.]
MEKKIIKDFEDTFKKSLLNDRVKFKKEFLNKFIKEGFPSRKLESWKFSDLNQIINNNIANLNFYNDIKKTYKIDESIYFNNIEHNSLVFVNGKLEKINLKYEDGKKLKIQEETTIENTKFQNNALINLNNAFVINNYKICVEKNYKVKKPLIIYHVTNNELTSSNINIQLNFLLGENCSLRVIDINNDKSEKNFINIYYNFNLQKDSVLKNFKLDYSNNNNIKYSFNNIDQDINSISETFILSNGSKFVKNEINCNLNGKYSSAFVNGIFSLNENKHHEIKTNINHLVENTKSYQLIKSVLENSSKSVYQGKIYVSSEAQKTDGYQLSKAILLNENSEFNAKPELEIYADDVKCSHGSASGSLNENSIFYLRSRGLNHKEAKNLLIKGFLLDVIDKITDDEIKNLIKSTMGLLQ